MDVFEQAIRDHNALRGKVIEVTYAMLGDGNDLWDVTYPKDRPLRVRVDDEPLEHSDITSYDNITDTYYSATALPGQLEPGVYVSWVDGPSYEGDRVIRNFKVVG